MPFKAPQLIINSVDISSTQPQVKSENAWNKKTEIKFPWYVSSLFSSIVLPLALLVWYWLARLLIPPGDKGFGAGILLSISLIFGVLPVSLIIATIMAAVLAKNRKILAILLLWVLVALFIFFELTMEFPVPLHNISQNTSTIPISPTLKTTPLSE